MLREFLGICLVTLLLALWARIRFDRAERRWRRGGSSDHFFANADRSKYTGFWT